VLFQWALALVAFLILNPLLASRFAGGPAGPESEETGTGS
jgi:hypothetical protein